MTTVLDFRGRHAGRRRPIEQTLRATVAIDAQLHEPGSCPLPVRIVDLSTEGCRLWAGYRVIPARPARLLIAGYPPLRTTIDWARDWYAGLRFAEPLHPSVVKHLVDWHQPAAPGDWRVASITAPSTP